ncbi:BQ2448_5648 [Microbotryum intermedium]|uniref:BQ2448_5648 protein n=1 Tax=Microbotryum intermedium TaxID=269621 RepID=A0A238EYQ0_9BASI|nr:BQ2448_5648 [Microbotryum intermedium]
MRYIIFDEPPTQAQVTESTRTGSSSTTAGPVWYPHHIDIIFPAKGSLELPVVRWLPATTPRTSVEPDGPDVTVDQSTSTQVVGGLRWVDRDDSVSRVMPVPPTATAIAMDEDETRFESTLVEEDDELSFASGEKRSGLGNRCSSSSRADLELPRRGMSKSAVFPPPSQLPMGLTSHETQRSRPHEQVQDVSTSLISSASTTTTTHVASQIDVGLPPTLHFSISSLAPFERFHSLLKNALNNPIHRLSILCVVMDISGPRTVGPRGEVALWEWTTLDPLSAPSMPVKISLWEEVGSTLSHATRRGDVVLLTKMSLKLYQTNLQLSTARNTQLQVCWRSQLAQEDDLMFRFHEYWGNNPRRLAPYWR